MCKHAKRSGELSRDMRAHPGPNEIAQPKLGTKQVPKVGPSPLSPGEFVLLGLRVEQALKIRVSLLGSCKVT